MKKLISIFVTVSMLLSSMTLIALAHSGRTDSNGGHNKTSDGTYHYHSGTDRTIEYSTPQNSSPPTTQPPTQPPTQAPPPPTEPATQPPPPPSTEPTTQPPTSSETPKKVISQYYEEFPTVPNFGYIAGIEPFDTYSENGVYVYQYDGNVMDKETASKVGYEFGQRLAQAGFHDYEEIEKGIAIRGNGLLILFRYTDDNIFSITIGELISSEEPKTNEISVVVDGEVIEFDQPPEIINGRTMIPIRFVVEKMGCTVEWDDNTKTVYINTSDCPLEKNAVKSDNINVYVNNEIVVFEDQQPINKNGRTLVPVRFVAEKLGYTVRWEEESQTVYIEK